MKVVILCGGKGSRIRDVATNIPKPMIRVGEFPILWHIMNHYSFYGFNEFILCLGHLGWEIKSYFLDFYAKMNDFSIDLRNPQNIEFHNPLNRLDWKITFAETGKETMTGSRIKKIRKYVHEDEHFLLTYGDGLSNVNIKQLLDFHKKHGKIGTVTGVHPPGRFGEIEYNDENEVAEFNEKPQTSSGRINGGFFVFRTDGLWDFIGEGEDIIFEQEPLRDLTKAGELSMYPHNGFWQPMDTYREYMLLNRIWSERSEKTLPWPAKFSY